MRIKCPNCRNAIEIVGDNDPEGISCPSCGSQVPVPQETETLDFVASRTPVGDQRHIAHFKLLQKIGTGAFGSVWRAHDTKLDRHVAIKIPRAGQFDDQDQFLREAQAAGQLRHPNIVTVFETGVIEGQTYISSDYIEGEDLSSRLATRRFSVIEAASLMATIARALHFAHQAGIVHRDLKPGNIMLDGEDVPYVMDFGLAKREAGEVTMTADGKILGTPAYMSPEQARGAGNLADARSDVYSLGIILYEMLTGARPFQGDIRTLLLQIQRDEPTSPRRLNRRIPADLEVICLKCLEKEPHHRYQSAEDLASDLERFLEKRPIRARPISRATRAVRWCQRNPWPAVLMATLLVSTTIAGVLARVAESQSALATKNAGLYSQQATKASQEAEKSENARRQAVLALDEAEVNHYKNSIRVAKLHLDEGDLDDARDILDRCPPHLRRFEWNYLRQLCNDARVHSRSSNTQATFTPDGESYVVANLQHAIARDLRTDRELWRITVPQHIITGRPVFTPDGNTLVTLCRGLPPGETAESLVVDSDVDTTQPTAPPQPQIEPQVERQQQISQSTIIASQDGDIVYDYNSPYLTFYFWNWPSAELLQKYAIRVDERLPNYDAEQLVQFSPDGKFFAFQGRQPRWLETATGLTVNTFAEAVASLPEPVAGRPETFQYNPHLNQIMWSSSFDLLRVAPNGFEAVVPLNNPFQREQRRVRERRQSSYGAGNRIAFVGELVAVGDEHRHSVELYHARSGTLVSELVSSAPVKALAISPDQRLVAGLEGERIVSVWDVTTQRKVAQFSDAQIASSAPMLQFSGDGRFLMSERPLRIWAIQQSNVVRQLPYSSLAGLLADGSRYVTVRDGSINTYDTRSSTLLHQHAIGGLIRQTNNCNWTSLVRGAGQRSFELVPSGHCAYVEEVAPRTVSIYDAGIGKLIATLPEFSAPVEFISLARDEPRIAVRTADDEYSVWSYAPVKQLRNTSDQSTIGQGNMRLSPTGGTLVVFTQERIWQIDVETGKATAKRHAGSEESADRPSAYSCISHDARQYVYESDISGRGVAILADLRNDTYRNLSEIDLRAALQFNHDGSRLINSGDQVRVVDTSTGETLLETPSPLSGGGSFDYRSLWISDDDSRIAIGSEFRNYYLLSGWRFSNQYIARLRGGQTRRDVADRNALLKLDMAPHGNRYATLHSDGVLRIQDCRNGRVVAEHKQALERTRFDVKLLADGAEAISVGADRKIRRWNVESGEAVWITDGNNDTWSSVHADTSETHLAAVGNDGTLALLRIDDGRRLWSTNLGEVTLAAVRFSPDTNLVAAATTDGEIRFFHRRDGTPQSTLEVTKASKEMLIDFAFSPGGHELTAIHQQQISRWDWARGEMLGPFQLRHDLPIEILLSVHYDAKNRVVLHGRSFEHLFAIRFDETGKELYRDFMEVDYSDSTLGRNAHDRSGNRLAIGLSNGDVCLLSVAERDFTPAVVQPLAEELPPRRIDASRAIQPRDGMPRWTIETRTPRGSVKSVALTPQEQIVASSASGTVYVLDAASGETQALLNGHAGEVVDVAASPSGALIASAGVDGQVRIWDSQTRRLLHTIDPLVPVNEADIANVIGIQRPPVGAVAISPTEDLLAVGGVDGAVTLWSLSSGVFTGVLVRPSGQRAPITQLAFSRDGATLAVSGKQLKVDLWDVRKQSHVRQLNVKHWSPALVFSPDGTRLYGTDGPDLVDWELRLDSREPTHRAKVGGYARGIDVTDDGKLLAVCGGDMSLVPVGNFDAAEKVTGLNGVTSVRFSPDGTTLYAGGYGSVTAINVEDRAIDWRQGSNGVQLRTASWSADGSELFFGGSLWKLGRWKLFDSHRPTFSPVRGTRTMSLSPSGKQLAVASIRDGVRLKSIDSDEWSEEFAGSVENAICHSLAWSPDGALLAGLGEDGSLAVWQVTDFKRRAFVETAIDAPNHLRNKAVVRWCNREVLCVSCPQVKPVYYARTPDNEETYLQKLPEVFKLEGEFRVPSPGARWVARVVRNIIFAGPHIQKAHFSGIHPEAGTVGMSSMRNWEEVKELRALTWSPDAGFLAAIESDHNRVSMFPTNAVTRVGEPGNPLVLLSPGINQFAWAPGPLLALLRQDDAIQLVDQHGQHHGLLIVLDSAQTIFIHPNGHVDATMAAEGEYLYVVEQDDGTRVMLSPPEFATAYGWENKPHLARLNREDLGPAKLESPSPADEWMKRGIADRSTGRFEEAIVRFQEGVDADPDHLAARAYLAEALMEAGRMKEARESLLTAARKEQFFQPVNLFLGQIFDAEGSYEAARIQFEHALRSDSWNELALDGLCRNCVRLGEYSTLDSLAKRAQRQEQPAPVIDYWRGVALFQQEKTEEAAVAIEKAVQQRPQNLAYIVDAVTVFQSLDRQEKVLAYLKQMKEVVQQRCEQEPENAEWHAQLATVHVALGELADAAASLKAAATLAGDVAEYWNSYAWIVATTDDPQVRDGPAAVESAERACELTNMQNAACLDTLAAALAAAGRFDEAIRFQQQAIALSKDDATVLSEFKQHMESYRARESLHLPLESFQ